MSSLLREDHIDEPYLRADFLERLVGRLRAEEIEVVFDHMKRSRLEQYRTEYEKNVLDLLVDHAIVDAPQKQIIREAIEDADYMLKEGYVIGLIGKRFGDLGIELLTPVDKLSAEKLEYWATELELELKVEWMIDALRRSPKE